MQTRILKIPVAVLICLVIAAACQSANAQGFPKPGEGLPKPGEGLPQPGGAEQGELTPAERKLREQIVKKLGGKEADQFILVFSKAVPATRPANGVLPPGARKLPNGRWLEVIYQVEKTDGQQAAVEMIMLFLKHVNEFPNAKYDWGLVARQNDAAAAEKTLQAAQVKYVRASVTLRPRKPESLRFFNRPKSHFFEAIGRKP